MNIEPDRYSAERSGSDVSPELSLATRISDNGSTTYHVIANDRQTGTSLEKVFDEDYQLMCVRKRTTSGSHETWFNPHTGTTVRIFESSPLSDGNQLTREVRYSNLDRSSEVVIVLSPADEIVRRIEREFSGPRTAYQEQTEYNNGAPITTVRHHMDEYSGRLLRREQDRWLVNGNYLFREIFSFDVNGGLRQYTKVFFYQNAGPFVKETRVYDSKSQFLLWREIVIFDRKGEQTGSERMTYDDRGKLHHRRSRFLEWEGDQTQHLPVGSWYTSCQLMIS